MSQSNDISVTAPYIQFLREAKVRIASAQALVARSMNNGVMGLYWDLGKLIIEKQSLHGWGDSVVRLLASDLTRDLHASKSFSARNLWFMRQLYLEYSYEGASTKVKQPVSQSGQAKVKQLVSQIPWGQNIIIMQKVKSLDARIWYLEATARYGWSRNILLNQIKTDAYSRSAVQAKAHNFHAVLPAKLANRAQEALKSEYNLEFLGIRNEIQELELESRLIGRLRDFILELGYGFCFIGRQFRLVLNTKEYFIDLLFYHRHLKALIAIDLKIGSFEPEFSGKMDFYLNLLNDKERAVDDNPSIGIILCAEKDDVEVEYALRTKEKSDWCGIISTAGKVTRRNEGQTADSQSAHKRDSSRDSNISQEMTESKNPINRGLVSKMRRQSKDKTQKTRAQEVEYGSLPGLHSHNSRVTQGPSGTWPG